MSDAITIPSVPSKPSELAKRAYDTLIERLMAREILPGDRISVDALVREFGISQTPIRSALSQLEAQGLVVKNHLSGYRAAPEFSKKDFEDLYAFRILLEPKIAAAAAINHTGKQIRAVAENAARAEELQTKKSPKRFNLFAACDVEFHSLLALACDNRFFEDAVRSWNLQLHLYRRSYNPQWLGAVNQEHHAIFQAVEQRDASAAEHAMRLHLEKSYARFKEVMP